MKTIRKWGSFLLSVWLALWIVVSVAVPASAGNCFESSSHLANWVNIPKYVLEDCMRTGYSQAILSGIIGFLMGGVIARAAAQKLAGGTQAGSSEPGTATEGGKPVSARRRKPSPQATERPCPKCGNLLKADARFCASCGHRVSG